MHSRIMPDSKDFHGKCEGGMEKNSREDRSGVPDQQTKDHPEKQGTNGLLFSLKKVCPCIEH